MGVLDPYLDPKAGSTRPILTKIQEQHRLISVVMQADRIAEAEHICDKYMEVLPGEGTQKYSSFLVLLITK